MGLPISKRHPRPEIHVGSRGFDDHVSQASGVPDAAPQRSVTLNIDGLLGLTTASEQLRKSDQATTYELMEWPFLRSPQQWAAMFYQQNERSGVSIQMACQPSWLCVTWRT